MVLLTVGRLDLVLYVSAGSMCALYAHAQPYAARARTLAVVVLGMASGLAVALLSASFLSSTALLVVGASALAAVQKLVCDAVRIGPPGNLIFTFVSASAFFLPQELHQVPGHVGLTLLGGALAWVIGMAPGLVRPRGPERIATARALETAARLRQAAPDAAPGARRAAAAAIDSAWHTLSLAPDGSTSAVADRLGLEHLLVRAESAFTAESPEADADEATTYLAWARRLRKNEPVPHTALTPEQTGELIGVKLEREGREERTAAPRHAPTRQRTRGPAIVWRRVQEPGSPLLPIAVRIALGSTVAGWLSMALGVGHPYWAVVTVASVIQANATLSWKRAVQRSLGNFVGLLVFALLIPVIHTGPLATILLAFLCQMGAEAFISRNYWLGNAFVTPMALLLSLFGQELPAGELIGDRVIDTVVGAAVGLLCCMLITNRRAAHRTRAAVGQVADARTAALRAMADGMDDCRLDGHRDHVLAALVELREAVDTASGEWWQRRLPEDSVATAEREGHQVLAALGRRTALAGRSTESATAAGE
ncbi:FUSC family protein [Streptomyces xiaopingdaonensis]|uniref:FUSC family protein n=1 Tax=Streptomyces xiaopingdaonensis TaxID=1565415 RepID=UPI00037B4E1B|nr:FUSC family protein [Streptomyces xiaopingdaonensis]